MTSRFQIGTYNENYLYLGVVEVLFSYASDNSDREDYHLIFSNIDQGYFDHIDKPFDKKDKEQIEEGFKKISQILPQCRINQYKYVAWLTDEELQDIWPNDPQPQLSIGEIVPFLPYTEI